MEYKLPHRTTCNFLVLTYYCKFHGVSSRISFSGPSIKCGMPSSVSRTSLILETLFVSDPLGFLKVTVVASTSATLLLMLEFLSVDRKPFALPNALIPPNNHVQVSCKY